MTRMARRNAVVFLFLLTLLQQQLIVVHLLLRTLNKRRRQVHRRADDVQPYYMLAKIPYQVDHMNRLFRVSDRVCIENLRMDRDAFGRHCFLLREVGGLSDSKYVNVKEQVSYFLAILGHHKKNMTVKFDFYRSGQTISHYTHIVLKALLKLHPIIMITPTPVADDSTHSTWKWFKGCLGALDGIHLPVHVRKEDKGRYRDRNSKITTNVLCVCDQNANFIYVLPGLEGSAADSRVLRNAVNRPHGLKVPLSGQYYLCDQAYANTEGFLVPYRGQRYHLKDWGPASSRPRNALEHFNMRHARARNVIERAFGILKKHFKILRVTSYYPIKIQIRLIMAYVLMHNFIRSVMEVDPIEAMLDVDTTEDEEVNGRDDMADATESSPQWNLFRDEIAHTIFNEWNS